MIKKWKMLYKVSIVLVAFVILLGLIALLPIIIVEITSPLPSGYLLSQNLGMGFIDINYKNLAIIFGAIIGVLSIITCIAYFVYHKLFEKQKENAVCIITDVEAIVTNKNHRGAYTSLVLSGKTNLHIRHAARWEFTITYIPKDGSNSIELTIDNEEIFNSIEENETLIMQLVTYESPSGGIIEQTLEFTED